MRKRRSDKIKLSNEARVLKELRINKKLSMNKVGKLIGKSDSYVAHLETGRMDIPNKDMLNLILSAYNTSKKEYLKLVTDYKPRVTQKSELLEIINRMNIRDVNTLLSVAKGLVGG